MQNKKTLLKRLLVLYVTFFIVLIAGIAHGFLPDFARGYDEGAVLGNEIVENFQSGKPRRIFMLGNVPVKGEGARVELPGADSTDVLAIEARVATLTLKVEQQAHDDSMLGIAFRSVGGSPWLYLMTILGMLSYVAIILLMILIIRSLRRSIRQERPLDGRNVWMLRSIGMLTILSELLHDLVNWRMAVSAARLLDAGPYAVDARLHISYTTIIMGILVLFAAEVFALGRNLSEEQKLTI